MRYSWYRDEEERERERGREREREREIEMEKERMRETVEDFQVLCSELLQRKTISCCFTDRNR